MGRGCVEVCFRELEQTVRALAEQERREDMNSSLNTDNATSGAAVLGMDADSRFGIEARQVWPYFYSSFSFVRVPYPRTSGATFAPNGRLVTFCIGKHHPCVSAKSLYIPPYTILISHIPEIREHVREGLQDPPLLLCLLPPDGRAPRRQRCECRVRTGGNGLV